MFRQIARGHADHDGVVPGKHKINEDDGGKCGPKFQ